MVLMQTLRGLKFKGRPQQQKQKSGNKKKESKADQQKENYYQLLGVKPSASESEIRKAYHQKIKEYHPDKHQNTEFEWVRKFFGHLQEVATMPNLIEVQKASYEGKVR